jgi:hypothetical protein
MAVIEEFQGTIVYQICPTCGKACGSIGRCSECWHKGKPEILAAFRSKEDFLSRAQGHIIKAISNIVVPEPLLVETRH